MTGGFRLALCQMDIVDDKGKNVAKALEMLDKAAAGGAAVAVLPEMFNCPYDNSKFSEYAETIPGSQTAKAISQKAAELGVYVVAGSIPEREGTNLFNTSLVFDRHGAIIGRHRKMHLFDIDIKGKIRFVESEVLSYGKDITIVETEFCKIGIAICYDLRFPELSRLMALEGAEVIIIPGAFNMVTGPAHWELLIRTRALDNQVYVAAASPARSLTASYTAYGNSMVASPWGSVVQRASEKEEIVFADIDAQELDRVRRELPLLKHRRTDLYSITKK
ncbi:MAG: carbon-nitrogen hydrolase family protein [Ruminiclostridium sp.]|nr:carbon-nitrogen hydrolase family protein [Ruminiclostridium sp.]